MAEPLLRKTFSRLRGREKLPRKKSDAKDRGRPAQRSEPKPPEPEPRVLEGSQAGAEVPLSPETPRSPARGAYLQSLEPSSRRWVLGGAKPPEEISLGPRTPSSGEPAGEIWYNPIPEEDPRPPAPEPVGSQLASSEPEGPILQGAAPTSPPTKTSRTKSPGPARRLSMKMKKLPELRRRLSLRSTRTSRERERTAPAGSVISRYHLDSSVATPGQASVAGGTRSPRGGYLSDGDSPERPGGPPSPTAFRPYEVGPSARAPPAALWGRLSLHLYGLGGLRPTPGATPRDLCCLLQVDGVARARTGPLRSGPDFLRLDHTFHLELEAARLLRALVLAWDPGVRRHRPCAQGTVLLPTIFRGCQAQQLAVRLEPQGLLYAKLTLSEQQEAPATVEPRVFGLPLQLLVEREQSPGQVPLIIRKCVGQIECRGLRVVGLYRLCGSAAVKKELRDAFEQDSAAVCLSEDVYPDINVITGILKDYLRELPTPLITQPLYQVVLEAMAQGHPSRASLGPEGTRGLLSCLPDVERATLTLLLDHLRLVSSFHTHNRMTPQNLAVCFGPVLLPARQTPSRTRLRGSGPGVSSAVDFKRHIEVLHYLLQSWPDTRRPSETPDVAPYLRPKRQPPLHLPLDGPEVVTRPRGRGGPESPPSNRYAGDWSVCGGDLLPRGRDFLSGPDYDHVTGSDSEEDEDESGEPRGTTDFEDEFDAPFNPHLNLKDFDALILDLERELSKQINVCL
ncbi:rho GTPase-activating protein SYDE1 [Rattus norvegicus]|uniref:Rho GTPase-activating protein SYDE1 n=2 Tax=Rattus norvegicus TaxID=10116 RepID=SYDE1_RAT|nr:rho GTPase-activating protein SYDE1 [Rattus norvegicus]D3ZZN9.1 RecName: Full=Rho GTPase-activating protein SYDE1; AltName: Full=Synapse defective protein 1 homolog 1; Short=Protein syd-1 homolog 1 [Rattus norvegicus]|eukprot:NP_001178805.1 rho GTPase-activating protein SYDE1 [Rattus norvegicus]